MTNTGNKGSIEIAHPHTIKKFELIERYVKSWAQKLMNTESCNGIIFIDCMCNSGIYVDEDGKEVHGTPIRVTEALADVAETYPHKQVELYFNDFTEAKIDMLKKYLPPKKSNFEIVTTAKDGNELLKWIGPQLKESQHMNYFLLYDPYDASIDWIALKPFFRHWGEVLINHMISDSLRAVGQVKKEDKKTKYTTTYQVGSIEEIVPYGSDRKAYERRVYEIINLMKGSATREYYVASFPFFNKKNALVYDLVHCTSHIAGFKLFKSTAWKIFDDQSSSKDRHGNQYQLTIDFENGGLTTQVDEYCYNLNDIADYIESEFSGISDVTWDQVWDLLDQHPLFPSEGYKTEIKRRIKSSAKVTYNKSNKTLSFRN